MEPVPTPVDVSRARPRAGGELPPRRRARGAGLRATTAATASGRMLDRDMFERVVLNLLSQRGEVHPGGVGCGSSCEPWAARSRSPCATPASASPAATSTGPSSASSGSPRPAGARSHEGAGIGLAMVKQLTELMGGSVTVAARSVAAAPSRCGSPRPRAARRPGHGAPASGLSSRRSTTSCARSTPGSGGVGPLAAETWSEPHALRAGRTGAAGPRRRGQRRPAHLPRRRPGDHYDVELVADGQQALEALRRELPDLVVARRHDAAGRRLRARRGDPADPTTQPASRWCCCRPGPVRPRRAPASGPAPTTTSSSRSPSSSCGPGSPATSSARRPHAGRVVASRGHRPASTTRWSSSTSTARVLEVNDRFTAMLGWSADDGPFTAPYPWDLRGVDGEEAPASFADAVELATTGHERPGVGRDGAGAPRRSPCRRLVRVERRRRRAAAAVPLLATMRDVTAEHVARERRAQRRLGSPRSWRSADELTDVLATAVAGFGELFGGDATVRVLVGSRQQVFTASGPLAADDLDPRWRRGRPYARPVRARAGRARRRHPPPPTARRREGRVCVVFPAPRRVDADERIAGDLLVQALALACDRVIAAWPSPTASSTCGGPSRATRRSARRSASSSSATGGPLPSRSSG